MDVKVKVGDEVIVTGQYATRGRTTVSKVGRKYFYVASNRDTPFQISDGHEKPEGYGNYKAQAWLPADYEADQVRTGILNQLRDRGVRWTDSYVADVLFREKNFSTTRLMELRNFLDNVAAEISVTDLDRSTT